MSTYKVGDMVRLPEVDKSEWAIITDCSSAHYTLVPYFISNPYAQSILELDKICIIYTDIFQGLLDNSY